MHSDFVIWVLCCMCVLHVCICPSANVHVFVCACMLDLCVDVYVRKWVCQYITLHAQCFYVFTCIWPAIYRHIYQQTCKNHFSVLSIHMASVHTYTHTHLRLTGVRMSVCVEGSYTCAHTHRLAAIFPRSQPCHGPKPCALDLKLFELWNPTA